MVSKLSFDNLYCVCFHNLKQEFQAAPENYDKLTGNELSQYCVGKFPNGKPEVFVQTGGGVKRPPKSVIASSMNLNLYHEDIIKSFKKRSFTGWESYPVKVYKKNGELVEGYHAFSITGGCGSYDMSKCKIIDYTYDYGQGLVTEKRYQGLYFDPDSWDGADIFSMNYRGWFNFVTADVMEELLKFKTIFRFIKLSEFIHIDTVK